MRNREDREIVDSIFMIFGIIVVIIGTFFIMPFLHFWLAYIGGCIVQMVIGTPLCHALNTTFGTTRFVPEMLPWIAGACGWIGGYFKSTNINRK